MTAPNDAEPTDRDLSPLLWVSFDDGSPDELALRTGPSRATIVSVAGPATPQRYGDVVVVTDVSGNPGAAVGRARHLATVHAGSFRSFSIVGPHPGNRAWAALQRQLDNRGWALWIGDVDATDGSDGPAADRAEGPATLHAVLAVPADTDPVEVDAVLNALTGDWASPPAWPELAAASGADLTRHERVARRHGVVPGRH